MDVDSAALQVGCLILALGAEAAASTQPNDMQQGLAYFSQFCMDNFPDVEKIEESMHRAAWKRISAPSERQRQNQNFIEVWEDLARQNFGLHIKRFGSGVSCTVGFDGAGEFPLDALVTRYSLKADEANSQYLSNSFPANTWTVFTTVIAGKARNVLMMRSKDPNPSYELTITTAPIR